jgi:hypothetical protein
MRSSSLTASLLRSAGGSLALFVCLLLATACGTTESVQEKKESTRTLRLTALDSTTTQPLDSARAVNRTLGDTMTNETGGEFVMQDLEPALYVFDVSGYGYHPQRHVSALVEPGDTAVSAKVRLLQQSLVLNCDGDRPFGWNQTISQFRKDSSQVRIQLLDVFAQDGEVRVQPILVNDLPTATIFVPDNFGKLGHYDVQLYDGDSDPVDYEYKDAPPDEGHRIYSRGDILPVVPGDAERLEPSLITVGDSIEDGETLYARLEYTFTDDDTLRATSATTFPDLGLDSLQTPVFDTVRTDGAVRVPDSLVIQRDTTVVQVAGIDTTVTRRGLTLFSTLRESNAASSPREARSLLYVPDSVKARARRDSMLAAARADSTVPPIDTAAVSDIGVQLRVIDRTNRARLSALGLDSTLIESFQQGLPSPELTADSLLSMSSLLRDELLQDASPARGPVRRGLDTAPDTSLRRDEVLLSAPLSDSLFRLVDTDTTAPGTTASNPFAAAGPMDPLAPASDSVTIDSLRLTVGPEADSVVVDSSAMLGTLQDPPPHSFWPVPASMSPNRTEMLVVDPSFFKLRARARVDTTVTVDVGALAPARVGTPDRTRTQLYPQQVIRIPSGTYRSEYLQAWRDLQARGLKEQYCRIFPFPVRTKWRSTTMRY